MEEWKKNVKNRIPSKTGALNKVNQGSNPPKFQLIVKANAQAKLQSCIFMVYIGTLNVTNNLN